jgi:DNA-binding FadR family transcriptional regulator
MLRYRSESIKAGPTVKKALTGHRKILGCMKKKDEAGLLRALSDHLNYSREDIRKLSLATQKSP